MNLTRLAFRDISGNAFRSGVIVICAILVAGLSLATVLIARGADANLRLTQERMGADIVVVPEGTEQKVDGALLMGSLVKVWLPAADTQKIAAVPGVAAASPQLYVASISDAPYSTVSPVLLVAYDPASDFTIQPWLRGGSSGRLGLGEAVGGTFVAAPSGDGKLSAYGYDLHLVANLEPMGTSLDQSIFVSFETARDLARLPALRAEQGVTIPDDGVSSIMVKLAPGADPKKVSAAIQATVPGVTAVNSPDLFGSFRSQMEGQRAGMLAILGVVLALSVFIIAVDLLGGGERAPAGDRGLAGPGSHARRGAALTPYRRRRARACRGLGGHHPLGPRLVLLPPQARQSLRVPVLVPVFGQPAPAGGDRAGGGAGRRDAGRLHTRLPYQSPGTGRLHEGMSIDGGCLIQSCSRDSQSDQRSSRMFKIIAVVILVLALVVILVPQFTNCSAEGRTLTLQNGKTVAMKCTWSAKAELALGIPLLAVGRLDGREPAQGDHPVALHPGSHHRGAGHSDPHESDRGVRVGRYGLQLDPQAHHDRVRHLDHPGKPGRPRSERAQERTKLRSRLEWRCVE